MVCAWGLPIGAPLCSIVQMEASASDAAVRALHAEVDQALRGRLVLLPTLTCKRGCSACCEDGLRVFEVEAARIRRAFPQLLAEGRPGPEGACAFLDEGGGCRIYPARPYVCRTQGLPLMWWEEAPDGWYQRRDICPLNEPPVDPLDLDEAQCWPLGPYEGRLHQLQRAAAGGQARRVALRALFHP